MAGFVKVGTTGDLAPGQGKRVEAAGKKIALFNIDGTYYAIDDTCTHRGGPLSEGELAGNEVTCPWHGATFDVTTGKALGPPASKAVSKYNVRVSGESVEVEV
jgi:nitrite reductase/ring-hydroxylating ferredoxin subunit